jgi:hypothetical protein
MPRERCSGYRAVDYTTSYQTDHNLDSFTAQRAGGTINQRRGRLIDHREVF